VGIVTPIVAPALFAAPAEAWVSAVLVLEPQADKATVSVAAVAAAASRANFIASPSDDLHSLAVPWQPSARPKPGSDGHLPPRSLESQHIRTLLFRFCYLRG
jgi:hypothetical protein